MSRWPPLRTGRPFNRLSLSHWHDSARGRQLLALERRELERVLPDIFGRHLLQIGSWGRNGELIQSCETLNHAVIGSIGDNGDQAMAEIERLPIASKSADAVVLPHALEFSRTPHTILREASRVLSDRGRLFVLGFNPWGLWGLRERIGFRYPSFPEGAHFYGAGRICDWLELLELEVSEIRRFGVGFPWSRAQSDGDGWNPGSLLRPFSEAYMVCARKRVLPVNWVGRVQRSKVRPLVGVATPAARREGPGNPSSIA